MSERFLKYLPNDKAAWLRQYHTSLYLLLSLAVERVRWHQDECPLGLKQGDAILGSFGQAGISRKQYRDAIEKGVEFKIWEIVWNHKIKKLQKRAIKGAIKSIVVNITNPICWDLNLNDEGHQLGQLRANRGPIEGHKQEYKEYKEGKEKTLFVGKASKEKISSSQKIVSFDDSENPFMNPGSDGEPSTSESNNIIYKNGLETQQHNIQPQPSKRKPAQQNKIIKTLEPKIQFADHVNLTQVEYNELVAQYGKPSTDKKIQAMNNWKLMKTKNLNAFDSDYRALLIWMAKDEKPQEHSPSIPKPAGESKYKLRNAIPSRIEGNP